MNNLKPDQKNKERPIDTMVKKSQMGLKRSFILIGSHQIKIWHMLVGIAFIAGVISALVWAGAGEKLVKTSVAPSEIRNQASAAYQDALGANYDPVTSNEVVVPINQ